MLKYTQHLALFDCGIKRALLRSLSICVTIQIPINLYHVYGVSIRRDFIPNESASLLQRHVSLATRGQRFTSIIVKVKPWVVWEPPPLTEHWWWWWWDEDEWLKIWMWWGGAWWSQPGLWIWWTGGEWGGGGSKWYCDETTADNSREENALKVSQQRGWLSVGLNSQQSRSIYNHYFENTGV